MPVRIYVVSKIKHALMWQAVRQPPGKFPIISTWLNDGAEVDIDFTEAWPRYLREAASATHVVVHTETDDELKGGLFEIGAALGGGAHVFISGPVPKQMRTLVQHPRVTQVSCPWDAFQIIEKEAKYVGREGERDPEFPCVDFSTKRDPLHIMQPDCEGDGHYLCKRCVHHKASEEND